MFCPRLLAEKIHQLLNQDIPFCKGYSNIERSVLFYAVKLVENGRKTIIIVFLIFKLVFLQNIRPNFFRQELNRQHSIC